MSKRKLLLADDSVTIQKVVNLTFADEDIEIISVSDGDTAMHKLTEDTPDLVMLDVNLSGLDGYQICEIIKYDSETKHIPVILLVGSFEPFDEAKAKLSGADDFLTKPFQSIQHLVDKVSNLLDPKRSAGKNLLLPIEEVDLSKELFDETFDNESSDENNSAENSIENLGAPEYDLTVSAVSEFESSSVNDSVQSYESFAEELDDVYKEISNDSVEMTIEPGPANFKVEQKEDEIVPVAEERKQNPILNFDDFDLLEFPQNSRKAISVSGSSRYGSNSFEQEVGLDNRASDVYKKNTNSIENLSPELIEAIADRVVEKLSNKVIKKIVREVIAQLEKKK